MMGKEENMRKLFKKLAAMTISVVLTISAAMPTFAATAEDYNIIDVNNGVSLLSAEDYTTSSNSSVNISIVDTGYNVLKRLDTSDLVKGNLGGCKAEQTYQSGGTTYYFSHYEYVTSVRNYVASYNSQFEFYVDPPMTIYAVYSQTANPTPPTGPVVGMYKDPARIGDQTYYYCSEAAPVNTDVSAVKANISFGRSARDESVNTNYETFSTQAANIYSDINKNNMQFIVASAIVTGGPIDFTATATGQNAGVALKSWDFGTEAFSNASAGTAINGITISNVSDSTDTQLLSESNVLTKGYNASFSFNTNIGDVVKVYTSAASISATGAVASSAVPVNNVATFIANSNKMTVTGGYIYKITINMYDSVDIGGTAAGGGTESQTYEWLASAQTDLLGPSFGTNVSTGSRGVSKASSFNDNIFDNNTTGNIGNQKYVAFNKDSTAIVPKYSGRLKLYILAASNSNQTDESIVCEGSSVWTGTLYARQDQTGVAAIEFPATAGKSYTVSYNAYLYKAVLTTTGSSSETKSYGTIYGTVVNSSTGAFLPNAAITLKDSAGTVKASTTSSAIGYYSFKGVEAGANYTVEASCNGYDSNSAAVSALTVNGSNQNIALKPNSSVDPSIQYGKISGKVTDEETNSGIVGALVEFMFGGDTFSAITGEDGSYSITEDMPYGTYSYSVSKDNYITEMSDSEDPSTSIDLGVASLVKNFVLSYIRVTQTITIEPSDLTVTIDGTTVKSGDTIRLKANNSYTITPPDGYTANPATLTTGTENGTTAIALTKTDIPVTGQSTYDYFFQGSVPSELSGVVEQDNTYFTVTSVSGSSSTTVNTEIRGKTVSKLGYKQHAKNKNVVSFTTKKDGAVLYLIADSTSDTTRTITVSNSDNIFNDTTMKATKGDYTLQSITLGNASTYTIKHDSGNARYYYIGVDDGEPTTGTIKATVKDQNGNLLSGLTLNGTTFADNGDGTYTSGKLDEGTYSITATNGTDTSSAVSAVVTAGNTTDITITLTITTGTLQATVKDSDGNPMSGASITATNGTNTYSLAATDTLGVYSVSNVPTGTYTITAVCGGQTQTATSYLQAALTTANVDITIQVSAHTLALNKMAELTNIILAMDYTAPEWNTESSRFGKNNWHYVNGAMVTAFLDMYEATGERRFSTYATNVFDYNIDSNGNFTSSSGISSFTGTKAQLDGVREATDFDRLYRLNNSAKYNTVADYVYTNVLDPDPQITADTDANAAGSYSHKRADYPNQIWLDGFFMAFPFYMQYAVYKNDTTMVDDVYTQYKNLYNVDRDPATGLYYHGYNAGSAITIDSYTWAAHSHTESFWLRAMAWLAMSYVDTLEFMPEGTQKENMKAWFKEYMDSVINYQDSATGMWYQVVDKGATSVTVDGKEFDNYLETSGSSGMAAALLKGYRLGYLDDIKYYNAGLKAFEGICTNKLYYSDEATSDIYAASTNNKIDWITPYRVTNSNNNGSSNIGKYMILKDICRVAGLTKTSTRNDGTTIYRTGLFDYYLQEFRVDNDGKAIAPLMRAYSEVLIHDNGGKKVTIK